MFSNFSTSIENDTLTYPINDNSLPFSEYIQACQKMIIERRADLQTNIPEKQRIVDANSPYEFIPPQPRLENNKYKYGALLIHGLLDCPFSLRDIGQKLKTQGIFSRAILLPGHGTKPSDLIDVNYQQWIQAVQYGVESIRHEVEQLFLVGYSTGAALSIYQALQDEQISGIILLSPAIRIKAPVDIVVGYHAFMQRLLNKNDRRWVYREEEIDYAKYHSIPFNAVKQVSQLTNEVKKLRYDHPLHTPILMIVSREDETISCRQAVTFFSSMTNARSKLLLYTSCAHPYSDKRITSRSGCYPDLNIKSFSHSCLPFSANNSHYGVQGDYIDASHHAEKNLIYGAYNRIQVRASRIMYNLGFAKNIFRELTYNPDFDFMTKTIVDFIFHKN